MASETHSFSRHAAPPKPAVRPWLLVPVVALALFFVLRAVRTAPDPHLVPAPASMAEAAEPAPGP